MQFTGTSSPYNLPRYNIIFLPVPVPAFSFSFGKVLIHIQVMMSAYYIINIFILIQSIIIIYNIVCDLK